MDDTQWWLCVPETGVLLWARLRLREDGGAELLESSGLTLRFDDLDTGRHYLMGADYRAYDGLDADDAAQLGFDLGSIVPPRAGDEPTLLRLLTARIG